MLMDCQKMDLIESLQRSFSRFGNVFYFFCTQLLEDDIDQL